ncbi:ABC transporter ATP-binding protein [Jatrophihabitans telluris]|uniref:ABC transporter ATP-binding protein n=1 Tax=Jatrophihabitans telluris TaxID=2038343 RepID=A0ABY4R4I9_9ACTN|nr:ABC transporter ATP-binding protein [Jatrophihabitans telluris]UQX90027.1 ABC transporter ATP-binding protein [Jatrophihabitans telluris]
MAATDASSGTGDLVLSSLTKSYGPFTAVDDLSLRIPQGSFFALLGPSGCGKTTTLRMVAGLEQPTVGRIEIGSSDITGTKAYQRPVNTVFQSYALFPHMTVWENVAFGLKRRGSKGVNKEVDDVLELTELTALSQRKPGQLSGGQQQRVALARAIVNRPAVLLLDEPLGALDLKLRRQMQVELKRIQTEVGLTFVHVTHDQEEAMTMADTIAVMNAGRIEQLGAPAELYENPQTTFVANFLGQSNIIRGSVKERAAGSVHTALPNGAVRIPASRVSTGADELLVGIRPEKVKLHDEPITSADGPVGENVISGCIVTDVSFIGVSTQYLVKTPWGQELMVFEQNQGIENLNAVGDPVAMSFAAEHTFALDAQQDVTAGIEPDGAV